MQALLVSFFIAVAAVASDAAQGLIYDYIIVGGGTTGFVTANQLSENSNSEFVEATCYSSLQRAGINPGTVLVIENDVLDNSITSSIPGNSGSLNTAAMYDLHSAPVPNLGNQNFLVTVGNVVGGGSYVHGMQFDRGTNADFDAWAELSNEGWDWAGLKPYFAKSNHFVPPSAETTQDFGISYKEKAYGDGPLKTSISDYQFPDMKTIFHS